MGTSRFRFGRRRRNPASAALVLVFGLAYVGFDHLCQAWQKQDAWSGTVVRVYHEKGLFAGQNSPQNGYWEVRTTDGDVRSVRIWTQSMWSYARPGDSLIKREGELHPVVMGRP